jgi:hypothetical protein
VPYGEDSAVVIRLRAICFMGMCLVGTHLTGRISHGHVPHGCRFLPLFHRYLVSLLELVLASIDWFSRLGVLALPSLLYLTYLPAAHVVLKDDGRLHQKR